MVDDNRDAADVLALLLSRLGNEVEKAFDGHEAIAAAEKFRPELVIMDLGMPGLSGYDAAREIRLRPWAKDLFMVAATGWGQAEDRRKTSEAGFNRHLVKPVGLEEFEKILAELDERDCSLANGKRKRSVAN